MDSQGSVSSTAPDRQHGPVVNGRVVAALIILSIGIAIVPVFSNHTLSINDYLNHLARADVLLHYQHDPAYCRFFISNWSPIPNLALDLWVFVLGQFLPVELAGKLFVAATLALLLSGVILLHRVVFKKWSLWPFLALLMLYNRLLLVGLLNFLFGVGLWLHVLALWIHVRPARAALRAPVLSIATLIVFFVHLFAFAILAGTIGIYELVIFASSRQTWRKRLGDLIVGAVPFALVIGIFALLSPHGSGPSVIEYRDLATRVLGFAAPILYDWRADTVGFAIVLALALWALFTASIRFNRPLTAGVFGLFALQFCMPNVIMTGEGGDRRIPIPMMLLAIAASDPKTASPRQCFALIFATGAFFALRIATVEARWSLDQPIYADARAGLSLIPAGARVATAFPPDSFDDFSAPAIALYYIPVWEVVSRGGFAPTIFAFPTQHPLLMKPGYAALASAAPPDQIWRAFVVTDGKTACAPNSGLTAALSGYDYVAFLDRKRYAVCDSPAFQPIYNGRYVRIYRITRAADLRPQ
jgi:hypothetical protein